MSINDYDYSEKRDFIRMRVETPAVLLHQGQQIDVMCRDLSSTGLQIETSHLLQAGEKVRVQIPSEHASLPGLDVEAEVVRVGALDDGRNSYGLSVLSMN